VVLVGEWRAKERHDAITHDLVDRALVVMHRLHHVFEDGIEKLPGLLGITVGEEFHRALEVGEQHSDLLALTFQRALGGEDLLGEVLRRVGLGGGGCRGSPERCGALAAELMLRRVSRTTGRTG
jgi:hypothetical protein